MEEISFLQQYGQLGVGGISLAVLAYVLKIHQGDKKDNQKERKDNNEERQALTTKLVNLTEKNVAAYIQHTEAIKELKDVIRNNGYKK